MNLRGSHIILGDCFHEIKAIPENSIDLIITSPPYADNRSNTYGGVKPDQYVEWFLPLSQDLLRILKPEGTFILNIKEKIVEGQRHTYVLNLILEMQKQGWLWTEEFVWHKKNCYPGKWPNRFREAWERLLQFNKTKKFKMFQENVMIPRGEWAQSRLKRLSETDKERDESKVGSGFGKNISNWVERDMVYPSNVLHMATECGNKQHSAVFPKNLPLWFIKLFTQEKDWVLDPFIGSGTTAFACEELNRNCLGFEIDASYHDRATRTLENHKTFSLPNKVLRQSETVSREL